MNLAADPQGPSVLETRDSQAGTSQAGTAQSEAGKWRREFEYIRHGTASLHAALDVHSGEVLAAPIPGKNDSTNFCAFLDDIERAVDPTLTVHVILDNGSSHVSRQTNAWFAAHPRWVVHYAPPHARVGQSATCTPLSANEPDPDRILFV